MRMVKALQDEKKCRLLNTIKKGMEMKHYELDTAEDREHVLQIEAIIGENMVLWETDTCLMCTFSSS